MKKKHLFIIIGQSVAILLVVVYAFVQQTLAKEGERKALAAEREAVMQRDAAEVARAEAEKQRLFAEQARMEADRQRVIAEEAMKRKR